MKLAILIPTLPERKDSYTNLLFELGKQIKVAFDKNPFDNVLILTDSAPASEKTIGQKRNELLQKSNAEYVCFFDDDDWPEPDYIKLVKEGIDKGVDCCSLRGVITWNGTNPELYEHSIRYSAWTTNHTGPIKYERYPNHLNVIKSSIAKQFKFPETNFGEDEDWSTQIHRSGLIKTEHYIDRVIYNYQYVTNK